MAKARRFPHAVHAQIPQGSILFLRAHGEEPGESLEVAAALEKEGHEVAFASSGREALQLARAGACHLLLADWRVPDMAAVDLLKGIRKSGTELPAIVLTDSGDIEAAVSCIKHGAYDYFSRPFHLQNLVTTANHALEERHLRADIRSLRGPAGGRETFGALVGRSPAMQTVFQRIAKIAPHRSTVLILGESGTGKEVVAREIHRRSPMAEGPFIAVNCGGVPGELIESELFGHERGAFTGATQARDGLFVTAGGGTLFLDEVGAMPIAQQASLLRSLERKEIRRVGGTQIIKVDVRVIAATNTDLEQAMEAGFFRQDLYYRLSNMIINLPSLRERVEDIPLLCAHFLSIYAREHGRRPRRFSPRALDILCNRHWPGNIRELQNVVEQVVLFSRDEMIKPTDLPFHAGGHEEKKLQTLRELEREHIRAVLARTAGNKLKAARILGIPRATLYHHMSKLGLGTGLSRAGRTRHDASD